MKMIHMIKIPFSPTGIIQLLEHIRYSDSSVREWEAEPDRVKPEYFKVKLLYRGSKRGWEQVKKRAESIGVKPY